MTDPLPTSISHGPPLELTAADHTDAVQALLEAAKSPGAGVQTPGGLIPYADLLHRARRVLTGLRESGVSAGDRVIVPGLSLDDVFAVLWGCLLGGIQPALVAEPVAAGSVVLDRIRHAWELLERPLVVTDRASAAALGEFRVAVLEDLEQYAPGEPRRPAPDDVALLMLSSGTTAAPKAAALTHRGLAEFAAGSRRLLDVRPGQTFLNWLPVDHSGALLLYHVLPVFTAGTNIHLPTADVLADPLRWLTDLARYDVAHAWAPTFGLQLAADALARQPGVELDLSGIRTLVSGGEQIVVPVLDRFFAATAAYGVTRDSFRPAWGMAETVTAITIGRLTSEGGVVRVLKSSLDGELVVAGDGVPEEACTTFVAVGPPAHGASVRIVDENDAVLPAARIGRLQVRSARVTPGYVNNAEATAAALPDGEWLRTGDLAFVSGGQVVITGREGDSVVVNGHTVFCHEIEEVAGAVDGVRRGGVAACGIPNAATGTEELVLFVEHAGVVVEQAVRAALYRVLRLVVAAVVRVEPEGLPRTPSGKIRRARLREDYLAGRYDGEQVTGEVVAAEVDRLLVELLGHSVDRETPFYELGLTSITLTRLRTALERRFGREIPATVPFEHPTAAALTQWLTSRLPVDGTAPISQPAAGASPRGSAGSVVGASGGTRISHGPADRRIAIVGMAARFPGARSIEQFWENLKAGVDSVTDFGPGDTPDHLRVGGVLTDAESFDAEFFAMSPKDAALTDPAHRQFLEVAHEVLEDGGYSAPAPGVRIGVYAGAGMNLYGHQDRSTARQPVADGPTAMQATIGDTPDFLASRVAYRLGLTGPAIGVQTACSTSLVAVHLAAQALLTDDADLAIAGAAAVRLPQDAGYQQVPGSILSPTGQCRPFDAAADGTVGGNGVAAVLLKRLDRAIADGDTVHAVILGSAVNNDGTSKVGFTAPSVPGQVEVVRTALGRAGADPSTISYVEAHGTGTALGDPVEFAALSQVFGGPRPTGPCLVGSVKANVGHLDSCAGMAGLIKTALMLRHAEIVPTLHLTRPHPDLKVEQSPFELATGRTPWPGVRRAGVSALGVGGTNAHLVLEQPPAPQRTSHSEPVVVPVSATSSEALAELSASLRAHLLAHPEVAAADVATTMARGRRTYAHRRAVAGATAAELAEALGEPVRDHATGPLTFAYSGQGGTFPEMSDRLYRSFAAARGVFDEVKQLVGRSVLGCAADDALGQVALFAHQVAWTQVWRSLGVVPDQVIGHSVGEYAALHAAGSISLVDGATLLVRRGELMRTGMEPGVMVAVAAGPEVLEGIAGVEIAVVNGPDRCVLAGREEDVVRACAELDGLGISWRRMPVDRAFHSAMVDPILDELQECAAKVSFRPPRIPFVSGLDGVAPPAVDGRYLRDQARGRVRFDLLAQQGSRFLEIGPDAVLQSLGRRAAPGSEWLSSQRRGTDDEFARTVAALYSGGQSIDWAPLTHGGRIPLPGHPLRRLPVDAPAAVAVPSDSATPPERGASLDAGVATIQQLVAPALGMPVEQVRPDVSFVSLGADSLALMKLVGELEQAFGVRIAVRRLLEDAGTPVALAEAIRELGGAAPPEQGQVAVAEVEQRVADPDQELSVRQLVEQQLRVAEQLTDLMTNQLAVLNSLTPSKPQPVQIPPAPTPSVPTVQVERPVRPTQPGNRRADFSLYFFGDYPDTAAEDKYGLILAATEFADQRGFHAVWLPERHFHSFGALFPNPSVLAAALATRTKNIRLHAGSVVLPLHHPIRVAEEWSVVDNLSNGRVGLCVASGWHARDFVLAPQNYGRHREELYERLDTVRKLWAGEAIEATAGDGSPTEVRLHPRPIQDQPPLYAAVVGNPESYKLAARNDLGIVTNLMAQSVDDLAINIARYRAARAEAGLDPEAGRVVVLLHTYLGADLETTRQEAYQPFCDYLRSSLSLFGQVTNSLGVSIDLENTPADDVDFLLGQAYRRYCESRALIGTPDSSAEVVDAVLAAGADEIACFIDFGVPPDSVLASLELVDQLRTRPAEGRPLTPAERRIWFLDQLAPGTGTYHEPKAIELHGPLNVEALHGALQKVVDRHPALRTRYDDSGGEPRAVVDARVTVDLPVVDAKGNDLYDVRLGALDLRTGPLLRARLVRHSAEHHVLLLTGHHIVFDSASTPVVARDLAAYYRAWPEDPGLPPVTDGLAEGPRPGDREIEFWREQLSDAPELNLPTDRPRPAVRSGAGRSATRDFDAELTGRITAFAHQHGVTVFTTLLTGFATVLSRFSGQRDYVLGTGVSGRGPDAQEAVGMFVDTLPLRVQLPTGATFAQTAARLGPALLDAFDHRQLPFDELVAALNPHRSGGGRTPWFGVAVEFENGADPLVFAPPALSAVVLDLPSERAPLDLVLYLTYRPDGVQCVVEYDTDLFDGSTVERMLAYFEQTLDRATNDADPTELTDADATLLKQYEGDPDTAAPPTCLHALVEAQADRTPEALALTGPWGDLSYEQLDRRANQVATELLKTGPRRGDIVATFLPRGPELVTALLGILKAGCAYLPLDPTAPLERSRSLLHDSGALLVVTAEGLPDLGMTSLLIGTGEADRPGVPVAPDDLAYCIYTSGSTGTPKGVLVPHRGTANHVRQYVATHPPTRALQWASPVFDSSIHEIFTTLAAGQALVLVADEARHDPAELAAAIRRYDVQRIVMPFSAVHALLAGRPELPSLREIYAAGEPTTPSAVEHDFLAAHPDCVLYNGYGPTEASVGITEHRVGPGETAPPIGRPIPGVRIRLLDADRRPVPVGAVGEICVQGGCVTDGYLNRPVETAAAFFAPGWYATGDLGRWRSDGRLEFHGRRDDQVQVRGVRIEPGEVRAAVLAHPAVSDAAVTAVDGELVGYVVGAADDGSLVDHLAARLPSYLVPRRWVRLERMPLTATGKLDRAALPLPQARRSGGTPAGAVQTAVQAVWSEVLQVDDPGIDDSFFDLGGHSLLAVRLLKEVRKAIGVDLTLTGFFRDPTIRAVAALAEDVETAPLTAAQRRALGRHRARADASVYNGLTRIDVTGELDPDALLAGLRTMAERHTALRTRVRDDRQEVVPVVPVVVPVEELPDDEEQLHRWCVETASPAMDPGQAPLWRFRLGRISPTRWVITMAVHHLVYDGWSARIFWHELSELYAGRDLLPPTAQYTDYARWEQATLRGEARGELEAFWRAELAGASLRPALPLDHPRPAVLSGRGATHHLDLPRELAERIKAAAVANATTPYVVIASGFARWLGELCGQDEVVLPASSARRSRPEHDAVVGYIGEAVLVRVRLDVPDLLAETARSLYAALDHEELPLAEVVRTAMPDDADSPYPAVLFTVITSPPPSLDLPSGSFPARAVGVPGQARTELYVVVTLTDEAFTLDLEYSTDLFTPGTIAGWATTLAGRLLP